MITFPEQDTHPLSAPSLVATHFGIDEAWEEGDFSACGKCGERLVSNEDIVNHAGACNVERE